MHKKTFFSSTLSTDYLHCIVYLLTYPPAWGARTECGCCPCSRGCGAPARRCGGLGSKCTLTFSISKDFRLFLRFRYIEIYEFNVFEFHLASFWRHVEKHWGLSEPSPGSLRQDWGDHHDMSNVPIITHPLIQKMFSGRQGSQRQGRVCKYYHYWKTSCFNTSTKQDLTLHNLPFGGRSVQKVLTFVKTFYTAVNQILFQADVSLSFVRFFEVNFWLAEI